MAEIEQYFPPAPLFVFPLLLKDSLLSNIPTSPLLPSLQFFAPLCVVHTSSWQGRHVHVHTHTHTRVHMAAAPLQRKELGNTWEGTSQRDIRTCHEAQQQLKGDRCGWAGSREELTSLPPTTR